MFSKWLFFNNVKPQNNRRKNEIVKRQDQLLANAQNYKKLPIRAFSPTLAMLREQAPVRKLLKQYNEMFTLCRTKSENSLAYKLSLLEIPLIISKLNPCDDEEEPRTPTKKIKSSEIKTAI